MNIPVSKDEIVRTLSKALKDIVYVQEKVFEKDHMSKSKNRARLYNRLAYARAHVKCLIQDIQECGLAR